MKKVDVLSAITSIKKGAFTRIAYTSEPTLSAAGKKAGVSITKFTEKTVRLGVKYANMQAVQEKEAARTEPKREVTPWYHWEVEDILAKHNTKDAYYLAFSYVNEGHNTRSSYFIDGVEVSKEELQESGYVIPSYFKEDKEPPLTQRVNIDNIITIGGNV